jgi:RHS repeat-associated protein
MTAIVFAGGLSLAEFDTTTDSLPARPSVEYVRGPDMGGGVGGMLYSMRASGTKYSLSNGRGDIVAQADSSATLTWTASYEAYGRRTTETGLNQDKQRGNSKDEDPTGLLNEGFRYRDLETGVWLSRDPAGFVDGPNVYAYVMQNPWTSFDPDGLKTKEDYRNDMRSAAKWRDEQLAKVPKDLSDRGKNQLAGRIRNAYNDMIRKAQKGIDEITTTARKMEYYNRSTGLHFTARDEEMLDDNDSLYKSFNLTVGIVTKVPGSGTADHAMHGEYGQAALSFGTDVALTMVGGRLFKAPATSGAPIYRTWNQFQAGTAGQFASRAEAGAAWSAYKQAAGIVTGATRSTAARSTFLRGMAESGKAPSWMNQWLQRGKVPPGYHVDHIKPLSIGGADAPANMRLLDIDMHTTHHQFYRPWE